MKSFEHMGLSEETLKVLNEIGFETPSEIQSKAIPFLLTEYIDFIGLAQTGTGKTAAFGLPIIDRIDTEHNQTQVLILAPTRELCQQITEQMNIFSKFHKKINILAVYGGSSISKQINAIKKSTQHIIVATPGRLIDLINKNVVKLEGIHVVVLDEADEMLNMGFKEDIDQILSFTPEDKMTWLLSATMPESIKKIINDYMVDPLEVKVKTKEKVNTNIKHKYIQVAHKNKSDALKRFIDLDEDMKAVVFCRTKRDTQNLAELLRKEGYKADALHGDLSQEQRDRVMRRFKNEELSILIATDVAARGIDVNDLTHVIHYALPDDNAYYTHRSGRTARAGKKGISLVFVGARERHRIDRLQKQLSISFEKIRIPNSDEISEIRLKNWCKDVLSESSEKSENEAINKLAKKYFGELTKEELLTKLLNKQLSKLSISGEEDLNDDSKSDFKDHKRNKKRRTGAKRSYNASNKSSARRKSKRRSADSPPKNNRSKKSKSSRRKKD